MKTSDRKLENILVTGGAGFIGSNFIHFLFSDMNFEGRIINADKLTYAGNIHNLDGIAEKHGNRYFFEKTDICDREKIDRILQKYNIDTIVHFAAESHVDRSISGPAEFITSNITGTFTLLEAARSFWPAGNGFQGCHFHHISTDEVYGSLGISGYFTEETAYDPRSPYSASKASSDHLVKAYYHTYNLPVTVTNCSNNYGPYQFPEKLIPLMIENIIAEKPLPVYGDGKNIRDWLYVHDHNSAVWLVMNQGRTGETYNIGGENEWENIKLVTEICEIMAENYSHDKDHYKKLITYVRDRPGHDRRYAIDCTKLKNELGWIRQNNFREGLKKTVKWYLGNRKWVEQVKTGEYRNWIRENYHQR